MYLTANISLPMVFCTREEVVSGLLNSTRVWGRVHFGITRLPHKYLIRIQDLFLGNANNSDCDGPYGLEF